FISLQKNKKDEVVLRTEFDMPIRWVLWGTVFLSIILFIFLLIYLMRGSLTPSFAFMGMVVVITVLYVVLIGFLLATIAGYFCGIVGSSNNPLSGLLITAIILLSV